MNEWGEHKGCELPRHFGKMHTIGPMQRTGPVIFGMGSRDRADATNIEYLENTPDLTLLRNLNRASLAVANKFATKKELDLTQILRRKRVT